MFNQSINLYRQGDILLKKVMIKSIKDYIKSSKKVVLAYGEATGHHHIIEQDAEFYHHKDDDVEIFALDGTSSNPIFVHVLKETNLKHEEHSPIKIDKGWYEIVRQREYSPERIRNVQD